MVSSFDTKLKNKFLIFKKLSILGLFYNKSTSLIDNSNYYNKYILYKESNISYLSMNFLIKNIQKLYNIIYLLLLKHNTFLFISLDNYDSSFLVKIAYSLIKKIKVYCIFDWGFGLLTNFSRVYYQLLLEQREYLYKIPEVIFFLRILEKPHYYKVEFQNVSSLSIGIIDYRNSGFLDYPIPSNDSLEYSYFFFRILIKILNVFDKINLFNSSDLKNIKVRRNKRLKFWSKALFKRKKNFKLKKNNFFL